MTLWGSPSPLSECFDPVWGLPSEWVLVLLGSRCAVPFPLKGLPLVEEGSASVDVHRLSVACSCFRELDAFGLSLWRQCVPHSRALFACAMGEPYQGCDFGPHLPGQRVLLYFVDFFAVVCGRGRLAPGAWVNDLGRVRRSQLWVSYQRVKDYKVDPERELQNFCLRAQRRGPPPEGWFVPNHYLRVLS